ncbi:MAG: hypothetical protein OXG81_00500 [Acidobacteria bacterium]|nr:hypothetical protein [Acidobacteriota bacterium]
MKELMSVATEEDIGELRAEIGELRAEMKADIAGLRADPAPRG